MNIEISYPEKKLTPPNSVFSDLIRQLTDKLDEASAVKNKILAIYETQSAKTHSKQKQEITVKIAEIKKIATQTMNHQIQQLLNAGKKQAKADFLGIVKYYEKMRLCYEEEIQSLKQQIKRQYKVIALMKQEVEDLMTMLNYNAADEPQDKIIPKQQLKQQARNQNIYQLNFQNIPLSIIEEETERTIMSSERSISLNRSEISPQKELESEERVKHNREDAVDGQEKQELQSVAKTEREGNQINQRINKIQECESQPLLENKSEKIKSKPIFNFVTNKHLQSIFCFHEEENKSPQPLNTIKNSQDEDKINESLFFDKDEESKEKYESYLKEHPEYSEQVLSNDSKLCQELRSQVSESNHNDTKNLLTYLGHALEKQNKPSSESSRYFKSHTKRKTSREEPEWESLSERFIIGLKEINNKTNGPQEIRKFQTEQSIDMEDEKANPKTKQFLEEFRRTFNKCLNSMQVAKKHSTKTNMKQIHGANQTKVMNASLPNSSDSGHMTFGKPAISSQESNSKLKNHASSHKSSAKSSGKINNKQNIKALDTMLKQLQANSKFMIGNKKIELKFEGEKKNGVRAGNGVLYYSNGLAYEGEFKEGLRHGYGILKFNHIEIYNGDWVADQIEGQGKIRNCAIINKKKSLHNNSTTSLLFRWISYSGEFRSSRFGGSGTLYLQGGQKFVGNFSNGCANGQGIIYRKNGQIEHGIWKNNMMISSDGE